MHPIPLAAWLGECGASPHGQANGPTSWGRLTPPGNAQPPGRSSNEGTAYPAKRPNSAPCTSPHTHPDPHACGYRQARCLSANGNTRFPSASNGSGNPGGSWRNLLMVTMLTQNNVLEDKLTGPDQKIS